MKKDKIGILTYHKIANNGAVLHAYSAQKAYADALDKPKKVRILDHQFKTQKIKKFLKIFKPHFKKPFFNLRRYLEFHKAIKKAYRLDQKIPKTDDTQTLANYLNTLITTMDVWNVTNNIDAVPNIPNIHWLPPQIKTKKIAYSVSAHRSDPNEIKNQKDEIINCLSDFDAIGARDNFTYQFVKKYIQNPQTVIKEIPDPTFMFKTKKTQAKKKLASKGIDVKKPIAGILVYGKDALSKKIVSHLRKSDYQIIGLSMFNRYVDVNFGDLLDSFEWAESFEYLDICISDRFHGSVFALKSKTPFVCIEPDPLPSLKFSKLLDLMKKFELEENYINTFDKNFKDKSLIRKIDTLKSRWNNKQVAEKNLEMEKKCKKFVNDTLKI